MVPPLPFENTELAPVERQSITTLHEFNHSRIVALCALADDIGQKRGTKKRIRQIAGELRSIAQEISLRDTFRYTQPAS